MVSICGFGKYVVCALDLVDSGIEFRGQGL
jgi:hypothetical protein